MHTCLLRPLVLFLLLSGLAAPGATAGAGAPQAPPGDGRRSAPPRALELVYTPPTGTTLARSELRSPVEVWPELLDSARETIDIAEFYVAIQKGSSLDGVIEHLRRAGARGIKIRFLVEGRMERASQEGLAVLRQIPNLELRVLEWSKLNGAGIHHAKYLVVDRRAAYVGSHNFDWRSLQHVQELGLLVRDPQIIAGMHDVFEADWRAQAALAAGQVPARRPDRSDRPVPRPAPGQAYLVASPWAWNPDGVGDSESELVRLIGEAREEIRAQVLDYAPIGFGAQGRRSYYAPIDTALRAAATRGVKVLLLVSEWNAERPAIDYLKSLSLVPGISVRMVTIPQAPEGFIPYARVVHAKYMIVDGKLLWVGTSNWTGGYLDNSRNLEVVVPDAALSRSAHELHELLWGSAYAAPLDVTREYPRPRRH